MPESGRWADRDGDTIHMDMNRRQFFRVSGAGLVGSSLVAMGFSPTAALAETRNFKLARTTETRSTCPYCSVSCGLIMYTLGDKAKNVKSTIIHIEGDPDHPVNRGTLCPKGAGVMDMIQSPNRVKHPQVREAGATEWKTIEFRSSLKTQAKAWTLSCVIALAIPSSRRVRPARGLVLQSWNA